VVGTRDPESIASPQVCSHDSLVLDDFLHLEQGQVRVSEIQEEIALAVCQVVPTLHEKAIQHRPLIAERQVQEKPGLGNPDLIRVSLELFLLRVSEARLRHLPKKVHPTLQLLLESRLVRERQEMFQSGFQIRRTVVPSSGG